MHTFVLYLLGAFYLTSPVLSSSLLPRSQVCTNDRTIKAGSIFSPRSLAPIPAPHIREARDMIPIPCIWCHIGSATYVVITSFTQAGGSSMVGMTQSAGLHLAINEVEGQIRRLGDGLLTGGYYTYLFERMSLRIANADNHQLSRGVMVSALIALRTCLETYNVWGTAQFGVFDGSHKVGFGTMSFN